MGSLNIDWTRLPHREKFDALFTTMASLGRCMVAYSGGVDSTLLLKVGTMALGSGCLGVIARSETLTNDEFELARAIAGDHCFNLRVIQYSELEIEGYAANPTNRCFFCKHELYERLIELARELGYPSILNGDNADDVGDHRPGMQAAEELQILSPLREIGLGKQEIRDLSRALGLPNWDKPAMPCLSSRIQYGLEIDPEKLRQVAEGEKFLRHEGFRVVRVRHHGEMARIEVPAEELPRLADPALRTRVAAHLRGLGFKYVTLDLEGFRSGSMNEVLRRPEFAPANKPGGSH